MSRAAKEKVDGAWFVVTECQDCHVAMRLPCEDQEPNRMAIALAGLYVCDQCSLKEDMAREHSDRAAGLAARLKASGLPKAAREYEFNQMHSGGKRDAAIVLARKWAESDNPRGMVLWGPAGTGKSRLAATATVERLRRGDRMRWASVAMLIAQTQASFGDRDREEALKVLSGTGGLVLDDLDKVQPSESVISRLFVAIDNRVEAGAPLLVTTNLAPAELVAKFGEAITSRLTGYSLGRAREMDGADRRMRL
jgi:DNA replication protein DnaC